MAFAAVLTALGYYIILRRFCQGLLKIFLQGAATGEEVFPLCRLSTPPLAYFPAPAPPGMAPAGRAGKAGGQLSRRVRGSPPAPVPPDGGRGPLPVRHWFDLPRGRGPSQTPKFLSPGPPSPWLPALLIGNRFLSFLRATAGSLRRVPAWQRL